MSDSDVDECNETSLLEKCRYDEEVGIIGTLIFWYNNKKSKPKLYSTYSDIPTEEYLHLDISGIAWLDVMRKHVYYLIRGFKFEQMGGSTGLRLAPNYIGMSRYAAEQSGIQYVFNDNGLNRNAIQLEDFKHLGFEKKSIHEPMYICLKGGDKEAFDFKGNYFLIDTPFNFTIISSRHKGALINGDIPFPVPSSQVLEEGTSIILLGYPQYVTEKQLDISYVDKEPKPSVEEVNQFFPAGWKTASLGKVKHLFRDGHHALISAAACPGMSGSPVFTFSGELIGFLIGAKPGCEFNIVILVSHPTFIVEYCTYCGNELMDSNPSFYGPKLSSFVSKNRNVIERAVDSSHQKQKLELQRFLVSMNVFSSQ